MMKKSYPKCYLLTYFILVFGVSYVISAGTDSRSETSTSMLPITLTKESDSLEIPNPVPLKTMLQNSEKTESHSKHDLYELYFCAADDEPQKNKIKEAREKTRNKSSTKPVISANCLFEKSRSILATIFSKQPRCPAEPEPSISKIFQAKEKNIEEGDDEDNIRFEWSSCGATRKQLYRFGYQIWLESITLNANTKLGLPLTKAMVFPHNNIIDYEIYRFCYDDSTKEVLYTKHTILSPSLLSSEQLKESKKAYPINISNYDNEELDFQNIKKTYDQVKDFDNLSVSMPDEDPKNILTIPNLLDYRMEKLIPPEDFAFILWQKPTFHYLNEKLMHKNLIKSWKEVNEIIQSRAASVPYIYDIYTGSFDILTEDDKNETAESTDEIKIPQIWIKIVHVHLPEPNYIGEINHGVAVIANNHMNDDIEQKVISEYCGTKSTYKYHSSENPETSEQGKYTFIRSCLVTKEIQDLFGLDLDIKRSLLLF